MATGAPIIVSVPFPQGQTSSDDVWTLADHVGDCQGRVLATWPDGSVKWLQILLLAPITSAGEEFELQRLSGRAMKAAPSSLSLRHTAHGGVIVNTGRGVFQLSPHSEPLLGSFNSGAPWLTDRACVIAFVDAEGNRGEARVDTLHVVERGPVRMQTAFSGALGHRTRLRFSGRLDFFANTNLVRLELTVQNPAGARHRRGYWDLGDPSSVLLAGLALELFFQKPERPRVRWIERPHGPTYEANLGALEIYQDSSGGENWNSRNHVNRNGKVPNAFRGYSIRTEGTARNGLRASPVVCVDSVGGCVLAALEEFWEQFPSAMEVKDNLLRISLWPQQYDDLHELQAGERNTWVVWLEFNEDTSLPCDKLAWVHEPAVAVVDPALIAASSAVPFFPSPHAPQRHELDSIVCEALEGDRSFFAKREVLDEYGWRNYGDMWADHEEAYCDDLISPIVSHYNNQYDLLNSLLVQFLRSADRRWWHLADPLARHIMDIDIYHTQRDKPAYNGGLFWHTVHYHDAGSCTHRSMSAKMRGKLKPAPGGGPANEHNYTSGLLLYYYLSGCERARESVVGLADWVISMDDGRRHVLGVLSDRPTGDASRTLIADYHGPGRGAGNSLKVLLDGWLASGNALYLAKAEELIRRTIHPQDDIAARNLGDAESRWSYTVFLQALVQYMELTSHRCDLSDTHQYARASLLHYARWMTNHERFYLDEPENLEFPTETWAAQELRKATTLWMAERYTTGAEREQLRARGREIMERAWQSLMSFESRKCTRPLAIVLQQGYLEAFLADQDRVSTAMTYDQADGWCAAQPEKFVDQKRYICQLIRSPIGVVRCLRNALKPSRWLCAVGQSWTAERFRQWLDARI